MQLPKQWQGDGENTQSREVNTRISVLPSISSEENTKMSADNTKMREETICMCVNGGVGVATSDSGRSREESGRWGRRRQQCWGLWDM